MTRTSPRSAVHHAVLALLGAGVLVAQQSAARPGARASAASAAAPAPSPAELLKHLKWRSVGPTNNAGRISVVTGVPGDPLTYYVAGANRKQDALRDEIKGRATQTYLRPDRKWIMGYNSSRIFNYKYFDKSGEESSMNEASVFELEPIIEEVFNLIRPSLNPGVTFAVMESHILWRIVITYSIG